MIGAYLLKVLHLEQDEAIELCVSFAVFFQSGGLLVFWSENITSLSAC